MSSTTTTAARSNIPVPVLIPVHKNRTERRVTVPETLTALVQDGLVAQEDADKALKNWRSSGGHEHPLLVLSKANLKALKPELKIVYTTGYSRQVVGTDMDLREGLNFLPKPHAPGKLIETVRSRLAA